VGHGVGGEGGICNGGNGEYVAQAWQGEVRKVGISGDGRRAEVEGGVTVNKLNKESKRRGTVRSP
jgi:hypothetical protein